MKISIIGINFYPEDTAIGLYSTQMAEYLSQHGHEISVVCGFPYYPQWQVRENYRKKPLFYTEHYNNITLYRYKQYVPKKPTFLKRIFHLCDFTLGSLFNIRKIYSADIVIAVIPFTTSAWLGYLLAKKTKAKLWLHIQDFEFDAVYETGLISKNSSLFTLLFKIEKWLFSKADIISTISYKMLHKLSSKTSSPTYYFPNWIDATLINPQIASLHPFMQKNRTNILYSGNIGEKQDWDCFVDAVKNSLHLNFHWIVVGDGSKKSWLKEVLQSFPHISFYDPIPFNELNNLLCSADIHILFQKNEVVDTVMPSKILGMLASSKPVLVTGHSESETKTIIECANAGFYLDNNTTATILDKLLTLSYASDTKKARDYVLQTFSAHNILHSFNQQLHLLKESSC